MARFSGADTFDAHPNPMSMNRTFQPTADAMLFRLSDGAERYRHDNATFKVVYQNGRKRIFPSLLEAFLFYITLDEGADLVDITAGNLLVERKVMMSMN